MKALLSIPVFYRLFATLAGQSRIMAAFVREYIRPRKGDRILDIGCGPADILRYLRNDVSYLGFDKSEQYIRDATRRFGHRAGFKCGQINCDTLEEESSFDLVLAMGVLHHLDDKEAGELFRLAARALKPGGRLVTFDGCFVKNQSLLARYIIASDRGRHVRRKEEYLRLAVESFENVAAFIRHDLINIPYTHIVLECTR